MAQKTLANCDPVEFLKQTYKIANKAKSVIDKSKILEVRKKRPELTGKETAEEKEAKMIEQSRKNVIEMAHKLLDKHADETAELAGLICFIEPKDLKNHSGMDVFLDALEALTEEKVLRFFTRLTELGLDASGGTPRKPTSKK